jgi:hypothetical protein
VTIVDRLRIAFVTCALALVGGGLAAARPESRILVGKVGLHDSYTISLTFPDGRRVRSIPQGTYTFVVHDYSHIHNFALGSQTAGRRLFTGGIAFVGTARYTLRLTPGRYAYACSAHPTTMNGTFVVTAR